MNRGMAKFRALATEIAALQVKAKALGLFTNDRELLECPVCELMENVAASGLLFTCRLESLDEDTGLRFEELSRDRFRCPACGAAVREAGSTTPIAKQKGGKRPCRARSSRS